MLTVNGKAEIVVQDAKSYQQLLDLAERLETIEAVKEGPASVDLGEGRPMGAGGANDRESIADWATWLGLGDTWRDVLRRVENP